MTGIEKAIQKFGTGAALGRALGFSKMTISNWKKTGIPPDHIRSVFELTGVTPHELRPLVSKSNRCITKPRGISQITIEDIYPWRTQLHES